MDQTTREKLITRIVLVSIIVAALLSTIFEDRTILVKTILGLIAFVVFLHSIYPLPPNHQGERRLFGWRAPAGWVIKKGWGVWIPFVGSVEPFPTGIKKSVSGRAGFTAKDEVKLEIPWFLDFYIDPEIVDENSRVKFLGISEETFETSPSNLIGSKLDKVGGTKDRETLKLRLKEVEDYVRQALLLNRQAHPPDINDDEEDALLNWYRDNHLSVKDMFEKKKQSDTRSCFESDFGIRGVAFRLEAPEPTPETARKLEKKEQQQILAQAAENQIALAKRFAGIPPENNTTPIPRDALVAAQRALGVIESNQSIEFGGLGQGSQTAPVIPIVIQTPQAQPSHKSGDDKGKKGGRR